MILGSFSPRLNSPGLNREGKKVKWKVRGRYLCSDILRQLWHLRESKQVVKLCAVRED